MKLLYLKFNDPASEDTWRYPKEVIKTLSALDDLNEAVGWLIGEDKKNYYIAAHKAHKQVCATLKVPKAIVIKKKILKL